MPTYAFWALTRLGAPRAALRPAQLRRSSRDRGTVDRGTAAVQAGQRERTNGWLFCLSQLARQSGLRAVDVSDSTRNRVLGALRSHPCPAAWKRMVEEVVAAEGEEASRLFGESLPIGLRLAQG